MSNKKELKKYFGEIMREYFAVGTPKYYKVNLSNPKRLLEEINIYINQTEGSNYLQSDHIKYLIEEYLYRSGKDIIYKKYNKDYIEFNDFLRYINTKIDKIKTNEFLYIIDELKNRINPIIRNLEKNYFKQCTKQLLDLLNKKYIKDGDFTLIKKICYSFSTEILRKGYSKYYIYDNIQKYLFGNNVNENDFIQLFNDEIKEYEIYTKIMTKKEDIQSIFENNFGLENIFEKIPFEIDYNFISKDGEKKSLKKFLSDNENGFKCFFLKLEIKSIDYISASNKVMYKIHILLDEVKFEYTNENINIFHHALSKEKEKGILKLPYTSDSLYIYRKNSSVDYFNSKNKQIQEIFKSNIIDESTKEKLKTIFRFYRYFLESNTLEHKFLNLWIGWEHIFSLNFKKESQTWKNIQLYYPFIDSISSIENILKDMIQVQFNRNKNKNDLDILLSDNPKFFVTNLYKIIKEKGINWDKLLKNSWLKENDLTKVKLFRLHEKFKSPKKFVINNKNKVQWNLYRLYRVRNAIVHRGNTESLGLPVEMLISDLENYYTNLLEFILNRFTTNDRFENIEQLFISVEKTYDFFQSMEGISKITDTDEIKKKIINLHLVF